MKGRGLPGPAPVFVSPDQVMQIKLLAHIHDGGIIARPVYSSLSEGAMIAYE